MGSLYYNVSLLGGFRLDVVSTIPEILTSERNSSPGSALLIALALHGC